MITKSDQSEKRKRKLGFGLLLVTVLVLIGLLGYSNWRLAQKRRRIQTDLEQLNQKLNALEQQRERMEVSIDSEDQQLLERMARDEMNLKKPGEKVVVVKKEVIDQQPQSEKKWWERWREKIPSWEVFFDKVKFWD